MQVCSIAAPAAPDLIPSPPLCILNIQVHVTRKNLRQCDCKIETSSGTLNSLGELYCYSLFLVRMGISRNSLCDVGDIAVLTLRLGHAADYEASGFALARISCPATARDVYIILHVSRNHQRMIGNSCGWSRFRGRCSNPVHVMAIATGVARMLVSKRVEQLWAVKRVETCLHVSADSRPTLVVFQLPSLVLQLVQRVLVRLCDPPPRRGVEVHDQIFDLG